MAYVELTGRQHRKEATRIIYLVRLLSATITDAPVIGSDLQSPAATKEFSETNTPTAVDVQIDEVRYPGRFLFVVTYEVPFLRTELGTI